MVEVIVISISVVVALVAIILTARVRYGGDDAPPDE